MLPLISKHELHKHIERNPLNVFKEKELFESFEIFKQVKVSNSLKENESNTNTKFHFIDRRGATLYVISRDSNGNHLFVDKIFDAPEIGMNVFYSKLPFNPNNFITDYNFGDYDIEKLYYADANEAFKVPLFEIFNIQGDIESVRMEFNKAKTEIQIQIQTDKYSGLWHWYDSTFYMFNIKLKNFEVELLERTTERYKW